MSDIWSFCVWIIVEASTGMWLIIYLYHCELNCNRFIGNYMVLL
uniref:Uncharacterized protein n=1 Tax=Rhizophora mucronata TaxID=61149 RepID=A0A2P2NEN1_RHIMU